MWGLKSNKVGCNQGFIKIAIQKKKLTIRIGVCGLIFVPNQCSYLIFIKVKETNQQLNLPYSHHELNEQRLIFRSSHFLFFVFGHFWQPSYKSTKTVSNLCLHFARQDGQDGKKQKENHATKVTKIPKTKRRKYGMNETNLGVWRY